MADAAFDVIMSQLKANPDVSFADVRNAAKKKGHTVYPISYGRAKLLLGLVKSKKGGKRKAAAAAPKRGPGRPRKDEGAPIVKRGPGRPRKDESMVQVKRGPGRPRKDGGMPIAKRGPGRPRKVAVETNGLNGSVLDQVQSVVQERDRLRSILAQLRQTLDSLS